MLEKLKLYLLPHANNSHRPYLTRHPALLAILIFTITLQTSLNTLFSAQPRILGFATNIYQQELVELTNQKRVQNGLASLKRNPRLDQAARDKAKDMLEDDYWAHTAPDGITPWYWFKQAEYDYLSAGENLARDFDTSSGVVSAWMASASHRENILYPEFTEIGMAVVDGELDGKETTLVVQFFGTPAPEPKTQGELASQQPSASIVTQIPSSPTVTPVPPTKTVVSSPKPTIQPTSLPTRFPTPTVKPSPAITTTPVPTPSPTPIFVQRENRATRGLVLGPVGNYTNNPPTRLQSATSVLGNLRSFTPARLFTLSMVTGLIGLFSVDALVVWREGLVRKNSHRLVNVGILLMLAVNLIYGAVGTIL